MIASAPAWAEPSADGAQAFADGARLLAQADFGGALQAYRAAASADQKNQDYQNQYALLRQVIQLRQNLAQEQDPQRWNMTARALRVFYYGQRIYREALPLDQQWYDRAKSLEAAALLAETQLELGMNTEAESVLAPVSGAGANPVVRLLHGVAQARLGRLSAARTTAEQAAPAADADATQLYHAARLRALIGDREESLALLARAFAATPPSEQKSARERVQACADFSGLSQSPAFATALATASKVSESSCSLGRTCGGCPLKQTGSCSHGTPAARSGNQ